MGNDAELEKPVVLLVHDSSLTRLWMERSLGDHCRLCVFSRAEEAIAFVKVSSELDILITDLDLTSSALGGCNIARKVGRRFPRSILFVFAHHHSEDHRLIILKSMKAVRFLSKPFDAFFIRRLVKMAIQERDEHVEQSV